MAKSRSNPNPASAQLQAIVLSQGYAMAASSYLQTGWAVFDSHLANGELYEKFLEIAADFGPGPPNPLYLLGGSLGGIVSLRDIEEDLIPQPDGALLLCGAVAGSENWRNAYDLRMIAETVCAGGWPNRLSDALVRDSRPRPGDRLDTRTRLLHRPVGPHRCGQQAR